MDPAAYWLLHTGRRRHESRTVDVLASPLGRGRLAGLTGADCLALAARTGWAPVYPAFDRNPLDLGGTFGDAVARVVADLRTGTLGFACEAPDAPENWPRVLTLGSSEALDQVGEDGLGCLLGTASPAHPYEPAPDGKLDLLLSLGGAESADTCLADVVLPTGSGPAGRGRTEFDTFTALAERIGDLAAGHLGVREDLVATPLPHNAPGATAPPGAVLDWRHGACTPVPGRTMPVLTVVVRDYTALGTAFAAPPPEAEAEPPRTGVRHLFLDHDWAHELGESLPVYRPPLDVNALLGVARRGSGGRPEVAVRRLTPHEQWSVHRAHPDDLFLPALVSGGGYLWLSPEDAEAIGVADGDLVEAVGPGGVTVAPASVSSRMPAGTVYTRRAPSAGRPRSRAVGPLLKPTRLLGGPGGLGAGTGDEVTVIRRPGQEVE